MADPSASAATRRLLLLVTLLAAVLAVMFWFRSRASRIVDAPAPSGSPSLEAPGPEAERQADKALEKLGLAGGPVQRTSRDRAERDRVRERIYQSLRQPAPSSPAPSPLPAEAGTLPAEYIRKRIREDFVPLAKECYDAALERDAALAGKLVFEFVIVGDESVGGVVESAEPADPSTLTEKELVYCLRESLLSVSFEPPVGGGSVKVTYPFLFEPKDGG